MRLRFCLTSALLLAPLSVLAAEPPILAERHLRWLEEANELLTPAERNAFGDLQQDYRRDLFIEQFWRQRDPFPDTPRNEFRDLWEQRLATARERFGTLEGRRAQTLLLTGEPTEWIYPECRAGLLPAEVWLLPGEAGLPADATAVFVRAEPGAYRLWDPSLGIEALIDSTAPRPRRDDLAQVIERQCEDGDELARHLANATDLDAIRQMIEVPGDDWLEDFLEHSTEIEQDAGSLAAELELTFPGRQRSRTVVLATVSVDRAPLAAAGEPEAYRFVLDGEVLRQGELFETFRYRYEAHAEDTTEAIPLVVERYLRPGLYTLLIRVESLDTQNFFRTSRQLDVPIVERSATVARTADSTLAPVEGEHTITLSPPPGGLHIGNLRVEARTTGENIGAVAFSLNGRTLLTKRRPPWSVEVNLGDAPRIHDLEAVALGADGETLASDRIHVNAGPQHFGVRLVEPQPGGRYERDLRARAVVEVPRGDQLDRLEFYLNEDRLSTLYQPPFVQPLRLPERSELAYVRAVAFLRDGHSTEALVFVNAPEHLGHVDVDLVELYTTVVDRKGRPVDDLRESDFEVLENEQPQSIRRFEYARNLPFHAAIVLDTSTSMADELRDAERAALTFFRSLVTPRDRAAVVTFSDEPRLTVPFTNDLEVLAGGLAEIKAEGETALHDSVIFTLYHFGGLKGQRALILLSDGEDSISDYSFAETLAFARQSGVAIYTIGLNIPTNAHEAKAKLIRLCRETGGHSFFVTRTGELPRVYRTIERELRSRYLLAYQSELEGDGFREVEVRLLPPGLKAKTIAGYDP